MHCLYIRELKDTYTNGNVRGMKSIFSMAEVAATLIQYLSYQRFWRIWDIKVKAIFKGRKVLKKNLLLKK